jgi:hypothetical protein
VLEGGQRIGRIRFAEERLPPRWLWSVTVHLPGVLPMGSSQDLNTAKAEFKAAWKALKARTPPEQLEAAYAAMNMNIRTTADSHSSKSVLNARPCPNLSSACRSPAKLCPAARTGSTR